MVDIGGEGAGWAMEPVGRTATARGGAVEGSVNAPDVGAVIAAEPKRGSKELSMGSRLLHQRHILADYIWRRAVAIWWGILVASRSMLVEANPLS